MMAKQHPGRILLAQSQNQVHLSILFYRLAKNLALFNIYKFRISIMHFWGWESFRLSHVTFTPRLIILFDIRRHPYRELSVTLHWRSGNSRLEVETLKFASSASLARVLFSDWLNSFPFWVWIAFASCRLRILHCNFNWQLAASFSRIFERENLLKKMWARHTDWQHQVCPH